jgi:hypothetical protein
MARWRRRRNRAAPSIEVTQAFGAFDQTLRRVEEAKASLAAAAPRGRTAGVALAEALAAFDEGLIAASASMAAWRVEDVEEEWRACRAALVEAERRARDLRTEGSPRGYEQLYATLGDIMEPLDGAFSPALRRFRVLGA